METRDLDASSFLASSKLGCTTGLGKKTCVLLMIPPLLLDLWNYNNGMTCYYEISREYYILLRHPTFCRCLSIRRHKRHKRPCISYSGSSATFHPLLIGDLVFKLNPGPTGIRRIPAIVSSRDVNVNNNTAASTGVCRNIKNLIRITCCHNNPTPQRPLNFCLWNCQSVRNKTAVLQEYLCSNKIDVCALTETWLSSDDEAVRAECTPIGYMFHDQIRSQRGGGGIALLSLTELSVTFHTAGEKTSFEFAEYIVISGSNKVKVAIIYQTPYSEKHPVTVSTFLGEFTEYLESTVLSSERLLIVGDMNIHVNVPDDPDAFKFLDLLECMGLTQHVIAPTHRSGHTLDLIITRDLDGLVQTTPISDSFLSDHCTVLSELTLRMPATTVEEICYRKTKAIDIESFKDDLRESRLCQNPPDEITDLVSCYGSTMTSLLDKHAPLQKKTITVRPRVPWFKNEIKEAKRLRRRYERIWRRTGLESDRVNFIKARNHTNHIIEQARRDYYFNLINENDCDQRKLLKTASALLGGSSQEKYPKHSDPTLLANDFGRFFIQKIDVICSKLDRIDSSLNHPHHSIGSSIQESSFAGTPFNNFQPISSEGIKKLVLNAPNKTCDNDPIPTKIVKDCINELLPTISNMVNLSLSSGHFPDIWKEGLVRPKLKNANMDLIKKNYRPVSNLAFLSKITEKAAALQISDHVSSNQMFPEFQSAYRKNHSTETALLRMRNDILVNMNKQQVTLLVFLDLSAAFDTVDHDILLRLLEYKFGIKDQAVTWFKSYLSNRSQRIVIGSAKSDSF